MGEGNGDNGMSYVGGKVRRIRHVNEERTRTATSTTGRYQIGANVYVIYEPSLSELVTGIYGLIDSLQPSFLCVSMTAQRTRAETGMETYNTRWPQRWCLLRLSP